MRKIHLYFRTAASKDRYFKGDAWLINLIKRLAPGKKTSGLKKVFDNLCKAFDELKISYDVNIPFEKIRPSDPVVVLGSGRFSLHGYAQPNPIIAGIGLMTHPCEWPDLFNEYPVALYLQHSVWTRNIYVPYYGENKCLVWPAGIDTEKWKPVNQANKKFDFLIYNKIMWDKPHTEDLLKHPIVAKFHKMGISFQEIIYGKYTEAEYYAKLSSCKAMLFLCEHESQGFACCEALSMNIPVLAWNQGYWLDPNRFKWNDVVVPATSVPYFDDLCGMVFTDFQDFENRVDSFWCHVKNGDFKPREYVLGNLTLTMSGQRMLDIINEVYC